MNDIASIPTFRNGWLTSDQAREIEAECCLPKGTIAGDRVATDAERLYLSLPALVMLAFHVERLSGRPALVVYEQDVGDTSKDHLKGANHFSNVAANEDTLNQWGGLTLARHGGLRDILGEDLAVVLTGWVASVPNRRFSWSVNAAHIRGLFQGASRALLLGPVFGQLPPPEEGDESPGKCIHQLEVQTVIVVHSILFQGASFLVNRDGAGLCQFAREAHRGITHETQMLQGRG